MSISQEFPTIIKVAEPLADYTHLRLGGKAEYFAEPRTLLDLQNLLRYCKMNSVPWRMLGGGYNLLITEKKIPGVVVRLSGEEFQWIRVEQPAIVAAGGSSLFQVISHSVQAGLAGLETLIGLRGSLGGSVRCNVGDKNGEISSYVRKVAVLLDDGSEHIRARDELTFSDHQSDIDEPVILWVEFALSQAPTDGILKRMRRSWINRRATEPFLHQRAVRLFRDRPGQHIGDLITQIGMNSTRIGSAELCPRNPNYIIAHPGTTAQDILNMIEVLKSALENSLGIEVEQELNVW